MLADLEQHSDVRNRRASTPASTSYATLRRGIQYERGYAEWCRWLAETLESADEQDGA